MRVAKGFADLAPPSLGWGESRRESPALTWAEQWSWQADQPAATQTQAQASSWSTLTIYPTHDLLGRVRGLALQIQSCRVTTTQGHNRVPWRSLVRSQY